MEAKIKKPARKTVRDVSDKTLEMHLVEVAREIRKRQPSLKETIIVCENGKVLTLTWSGGV